MTASVALSEVLEVFETGKRPKGGAVESGVPSLGGEHVSAEGTLKLDNMRYVPEPFFQEMRKGRLTVNDILIVKDGATTGRVGMIEPSFPFDHAGINEHLFLLRADTRRLVPMFLYFYLRSKQGQAQIMSDFRGAAQGGISREIGEKVRFSLPPIVEQRRIVDILSRAEGIVRLRREAQKKTAEIIPALFIDVFGDPATNPKNLPITELGRFISFITSGSRGWAKYYAPEGTRFIRSLDVRMNSISDENAVFVNAPPGAEADRTRVSVDDVLLTITGSQIGRVAPVSGNVAGAFVSQHVAILRLEAGLSPKFLSMFLSLDAGGQREIARLQYGQTKPGLSLQQIRKFMVLVPSISLQNKFIDKLEQLQSIQSQQSTATTKAEATFNALLAQIFT
jgi:type I restriction enzyme S subunit